MSDRPMVALTTSFDSAAGSYARPQVVLYSAYLTALDEVGLAAVLITPSHSRDSTAALLARCHGLILSGGGDVDPSLYGEAEKPGLDWVSRERDDAEMRVLRMAIDRRIPVFGICRGIQVMNVAFGGTLYQDIDRDRAEPGVQHQQTEGWDERVHDIEIETGSLLHGIVGTGAIRTNSFHHQAVRDLASGLHVCGLAEDGLVEAVEMPAYSWGVGVQWHPERRAETLPADDADRLLFRAFAEAVSACRSGAAEPVGPR